MFDSQYIPPHPNKKKKLWTIGLEEEVEVETNGKKKKLFTKIVAGNFPNPGSDMNIVVTV